ncbi:MAG: DUF2190 family protein [Candidatus Thermoplasmatota archaeon]|nr:DUF2190 family protein [Candidatus Thermoplasmatota archaeon]
MQSEGYPTFLAGEALAARRNVKLSPGTITNPPEVIYADAGEYGIGVVQFAAALGTPVAVKLWNDSGTFEVTAAKAIAEGAVVYAANDGKVSDAAVGTALGTAKEAAGGDNSIIEMLLTPFLATAAGNVSVEDAADFFAGATVEAVLAELGQNMASAQYLIQPAGAITLETGAPTVVFADGVSDGFTQLSNKEIGLRWNNGANPTKFAARFLLPPDLDRDADLIVHYLGAIVKAGADEVDSPVMLTEGYFAALGAAMAADDDVGGDSGEFLVAEDDKYQEKTFAIAAADIPEDAGVLTLIFNPKDGQLGTDDFVLAGVWLEGTRKKLAA